VLASGPPGVAAAHGELAMAGASMPATPDGPPPISEFELQPLGQNQTYKGIIIALLVGIVSVVGCVGGLGLVIWEIMDTAAVEKKVYESIKIGDSEKAVRAKLPDDDFRAQGVTGGNPIPEGAACVSYSAAITFEPEYTDKDPHYRFCFRDGALISKEQFEPGK
jgi:hypothetical protein